MKFRRAILVAICSLVLLAGLSQTALAAGSTASPPQQGTSYAGQGNAQGYSADGALQIGTVVQLATGSSSKVAAVSKKDAPQTYGVVIDPHQLSVTVSSSDIPNEVFVATSGTYDVVVSNETGGIHAGDFVTASSVAGVGMDAGTDGTTVLGRAIGSFDGKNNVLGTTQLKDSGGQVIKTVTFGLIPVSISVEHNPNIKSTKVNLPPALQRIGLAAADKPISALRIYLSIAITVASIIIAVVMLYAGIRNAVVSVGRNPLSKKTIFRGLLEIILTSILIVIIGLFAVYLLLKL